MRTGLVKGTGQENDQRNGFAVDGAKLDRVRGLAQCHAEVLATGDLSMGDGDAVPDAGGARLLSLPDRLAQLLPISDADRIRQNVNQLKNGILLGFGRQRNPLWSNPSKRDQGVFTRVCWQVLRW